MPLRTSRSRAPGDRDVDGDQQRVEPGLGGPVDQRHRPVAVLPHVELEPVPAARGRPRRRPRSRWSPSWRARTGCRRRPPRSRPAISPSVCIIRVNPVGAIPNGSATRLPSTSREVSTVGDVAQDRRDGTRRPRTPAGPGPARPRRRRRRRCSRRRPSAYAACATRRRSSMVSAFSSRRRLADSSGFLNCSSGAQVVRLRYLTLHRDASAFVGRWRTGGGSGRPATAGPRECRTEHRSREPAPGRCPARSPRCAGASIRVDQAWHSIGPPWKATMSGHTSGTVSGVQVPGSSISA